MEYHWDQIKNLQLAMSRNICFEDIVAILESEGFIDNIQHPNQSKYPNQYLFFIRFNKYIYVVPYVKNKHNLFLKTIYPSRAATKKYLKKGK